MEIVFKELEGVSNKIDFCISAFHQIRDENERLKESLQALQEQMNSKEGENKKLKEQLANKEKELQKLVAQLEKVLD